jgi:hypothetical protein
LTAPERAAAMRRELAALRGKLGTPGVPERVARGIIGCLDTLMPPSQAIIGALPRVVRP